MGDLTNNSVERLILGLDDPKLKLTDDQKIAVSSDKRRVLVVAGAGSGKTEVMARRIAWWVGVQGISKDQIVAFTFTERAAEEMKFRIRSWIGKITPEGEEVSLGQMYIGTIHGYCLAKLREWWPDNYHNYDILDNAARTSLIQRGFNGVLGLNKLREALSVGRRYPVGQYSTIERFMQTYDMLHEHNLFDAELTDDEIPIELGEAEREWCKGAHLLTNIGSSAESTAFSECAARYYAYIRCRRFLDFSTSQTEFIRRLKNEPEKFNKEYENNEIHLIVDEVQDINPVQEELVRLLVGNKGRLTTVGDHRQAIYGFRGAKVDIIAKFWEELQQSEDGEVVDLKENFRSTEAIIDLSNLWADTILPLRGMASPSMAHGNTTRTHAHSSHMALTGFPDRMDEAAWIAQAIKILVPDSSLGAKHDKRDGTDRGLALSDVAILVRSSTDVRTYMQVLEQVGIPSIVRAGPDLFSQPEVLLFVSALSITAGMDQYYGSDHNPKSMTKRIDDVLGCEPEPMSVFRASASIIRKVLPFSRESEERLLLAATALQKRIIYNESCDKQSVQSLRSYELKAFLTKRSAIRRVFPQKIYHWLLTEAAIEQWDTVDGRGQAAMYHLGAFSKIITGIETPGWTSANDYKWQMIGLCQYGSEEGRAEEQPLMVQPDAVTISTIHAVKGLEFAAVFLADVCPRRFPSSRAKVNVDLPISDGFAQRMDVDSLSDNDNNDSERRLMYVALTRAERFLFVTHSGKQTSKFIKELRKLMKSVGGMVSETPQNVLHELKYAPKEHSRDINLATSFSDLRYYVACPHDFYLRKVLGFAPTIDQAFGYGRGVHNLMRAIHSDPRTWAEISEENGALEAAVGELVRKGMFYLRYTTGEPAENMREKGAQVVADYVRKYIAELRDLHFEPEKPFETLIEYPDGNGGAIVTGSIDVVRQDDPPRVTLIDFKSGDDSADARKLDEDEMALQIGIYAIAAKSELEYEPEQGLVRYLGVDKNERGELKIPLGVDDIEKARRTVSQTAASIRNREFKIGPKRNQSNTVRCTSCDFLGFCGMPEALSAKNGED